MNRRRLDWEATHDTLLATGGLLDLSVGGPAIDIFAKPFSKRRALYGLIDRQNLPGVLRTFDFAIPDTHSPKRFATTVPQQALYLMNNGFVVEQARRLADRSVVADQTENAVRIGRLFVIALNRPPDAEELKSAEDFLQKADSQTDSDKDKLTSWERLAQALLMTNEYVTVD
jgi:hypothetical protein